MVRLLLFILVYKKITMRIFTSLFLFFCFGFNFAQSNFDSEFSTVKSLLTDWDGVRGEWAGNAIVSMATNKPCPDRTFPEEVTVFELLNVIPRERLRNIQQEVQNQQQISSAKTEWQRVSYLVNHLFCSKSFGRSYGDPHLVSFDNANYSFQTVGEFHLAKSRNGHFEVQSRQRPQNDNFSLNTAIAMNVAGDRLCFYTDERPDFNESPFRLNGTPIQLSGRAFFLPNGGTIRLEGRNYIVSWPSGERVILDKRTSGMMRFTNVTVEIFRCDNNEFEGLLGNNNGFMDDDFNGRNNQSLNRPVYASFSTFGNPALASASRMAEQEYLSFLAKDFADNWRVTNQTTLFDYSPGQTTDFYTDRRFPKVHYTLSDLNQDRQTNARRRCEQMGVSSAEMNGCIFDNGFLDMQPNPIPNPSDVVSSNSVLPRLSGPSLNTNQVMWSAPHKGDTPTPQPIETNPAASTDGKTVNKSDVPKTEQSSDAPKIQPNVSIGNKIGNGSKPFGGGISVSPKPADNPVVKPVGPKPQVGKPGKGK